MIGKAGISTEQTRGLNGLRSEELRLSRLGWWDEPFTQFLLRWIPRGTLVDVGCGLATAAHALLPSLSDTTYLGIDADENRLYEAEKLLAGTSYVGRARLRRGRAKQLPCSDRAADIVLTSMTLQHVADVGAALFAVKRVLRATGRLVAVEPDNLANRPVSAGGERSTSGSLRRSRDTLVAPRT
jgi:ubiquinone/menaquinone biosynthesis C-methylase UbiE